ncbi:MAG: hypothetical protein MK108_14970 [Mariniblastus sp.]|nr:hypothetical protein [Mariniblastus sp.]
MKTSSGRAIGLDRRNPLTEPRLPMLRPALFACCFPLFLLNSFVSGNEVPVPIQPTPANAIPVNAIPLPPNQVEAAEFANSLAASLSADSDNGQAYPVELVVISSSGGQADNGCCQGNTSKGRAKRKRGSRRGCR